MAFHPVKDVFRGADKTIRPPAFRGFMTVNVTEQRYKRLHAGLFAGLDIALSITHIQTFFWAAAGSGAGVQHGFRVGLAVGDSITTDHADGRGVGSQLRYQWIG